MASVAGSNYLIYVSTDGTPSGTMNELDFQGDLTLNTNRSVTTEEFKNGAFSGVNTGYYSGSCTLGLAAPLTTAQQDVLDHHDNKTTGYIQIKSAISGALQFQGYVKMTLEQATLNTSGPATWTFSFAQDGTFTRTTT